MSAGDTRSQRAAVFIYFGVIAANMMVLPTWFAPGRFPVSSRVAFIALNVLLIVFCAWKVSQLLGANPLRRRGSHPSAQLRDSYGDDLYASDPDTDELPRIDALDDELDEELVDELDEELVRHQDDVGGDQDEDRDDEQHAERVEEVDGGRDGMSRGSGAAVVWRGAAPYGGSMRRETASSEELRQAVLAYYDALDRDDMDSVLGCFSGDVLYRRPGYRTMTGIDQLRSYYEHERKLAAGRHLVRDVLVEDAQVAAQGMYEGQLRDGDRMAMGFAAFFVFDGMGRISEHTTYFFTPAV